MQLKTLFDQRSNIYNNYLQEISGIKFTIREVDIISCILHDKHEKKIAAILAISPKTVGTHSRNIMGKLGCNSKNQIINFIQKSQTIESFKLYHLSLLVETLFEKYIRKTSIFNAQMVKCVISNVDNNNQKLIHFLDRLETHLKLANISLKVNAIVDPNMSTDHTYIYVLTDIEEKLPDYFIGLIINDQNEFDISKLTAKNLVDFSLTSNYYFSFFELLQKIIDTSQVTNIKEKFQQELEIIVTNYSNINISAPQQHNTNNGIRESHSNNIGAFQKVSKLKTHILKYYNKKYIPTTLTTLCIMGIIFHIINLKTNFITNMHITKPSIRSDLVIPNEKVLLERPDIIQKMQGLLTQEKNDIKTIALTGIVGIGGAGKTTLARYYAKFISDASIIWELNAEKKESLINAFQDLAYALAINTNKQEILEHVINTQDPSQKEKKLLLLVKTWLKEKQKWLLIYDNVENLMDIKEFLPQDPKVWGDGGVIITTRNTNIQNTEYLTQSDIIQVNELNNKQKLTLFSKIFYSKLPERLTSDETQQAENFLNHIPPFPLDVSSAACYLQSTSASFDQYLKDLENINTEFETAQGTMLKEKGPYTETRYNIITTSLQSIINTNEQFLDLALLISLLDSQNIPKALLESCKDHLVVGDFIHNLKKYSIITTESSSTLGPTFSIHRSTQAIMVSYLKHKLDLEKNKEHLVRISNALEKYMYDLLDKEDFFKCNVLLKHFKTFLNHKILPEEISGSIGAVLGGIYCNLEYYDEETAQVLESSIKSLEHQANAKSKITNLKTEDIYIKLARAKAYLGSMHAILGYYDKANNLLESSLKIYHKYQPDHIGIAMVLRYLGVAHMNAGNYNRAQNYFESSIEIYQRTLDEVNIAFSKIYLGIIHTELGNYEKAKNFLEQSIVVYKKHYSENHLHVAWAWGCLGVIHNTLGEYNKAKELFEQVLKFCKKHYGDANNIYVAQVFVNLGNIYRGLGNYTKAQEFIEYAVTSLKNGGYDENIYMGLTLLHLGNFYISIEDYEKAKETLEQSLAIYKAHFGDSHVQTAQIFCALGRAYLLKPETLGESENLLNKAKEAFQTENHPEIIVPLELFGDLYSKKAEIAKHSHRPSLFEDLKSQSINYYKQALSIGETYLPKNSAHITRIHSKITNLVSTNL